MAVRIDPNDDELFPLPPGMVPSRSRQTMSANVFPDQKDDNTTVNAFRSSWQAKVGVIHPSQQTKNLVEPTVSKPAVPPPEVWSDEIQRSTSPTYHIDLDCEENGDNRTGTTRIKVSGPSWQSMSPWRRHNKVTPIKVKKVQDVTFMGTPLQSASESFLLTNKENTKPKTDLKMRREKQNGRPGSAPSHNKRDGVITNTNGGIIGTIEIHGENLESTPVRVKPLNLQQDPSPSQSESDDNDPTYSRVKKSKSRQPQQSPSDSPPPLPPRGEDFEPRYVQELDYSSPSNKEHNLKTDVINVLSKTAGHSLDDSLYESLRDDEEVTNNPNLYRGVNKHVDNGSVQLVSVQGAHQPQTTRGILIDAGSSNMHPIHYAAAKGDKKELAEILSQLPIIQDPVERVLGSDKFCQREGVDVKDGEGRTALMHAVHFDHPDCVHILADAGANINLESTDESTCLHEAAYSGNLLMVALLLSLGADGMKRDNEGRVPLHWATHNRNPKCIHLLLDKVPGLTPNIADGDNMTPLMWAAFHGQADNIEALKEKGADPKLVDCDGMRAIHWSVKQQDTKTLQVLLTTESSEYQDLRGKTVMHHIAQAGYAKGVEIVKAVRPLSVNDQDHNGRTPLHWATVCEKPDVLRALMAARADTTIRDIYDYTALDYAIEKGLHYCALLLTQKEQTRETTNYEKVMMFGEGTAIGVRTLLQQEGQVLSHEVLTEQLTEEHILQMKTVCTGAWMNKFTSDGRGPLHPRFFWVDPTTMKIHWAKTIEARYINNKDTKSDFLVGVRSSASTSILKRKDFDPIAKHKFAFTIFTNNKILDVIALSSEDFKTWLNGLQLLLHLGSERAIKVINGSSRHTRQ